MRSNDCAIQVHFLEVGILGKFGEDSVPHAFAGPAAEAYVHAVPTPESSRQVTPWQPGAEDKQDGFHEQAVVGGTATWIRRLAWQNISNALPLVVTQHVSFFHA